VPEKARNVYESACPQRARTFTHGDLTSVNIIVREGNLAGILDWEGGGYFPVWWEFTCAGISLGEEDFEWKSLLRKHIPDYTAAREFWLDFYALRKYPRLDERGAQLMQELLED
jgi:aminoglycoside phosphotransferase (APT) family kinase protein